MATTLPDEGRRLSIEKRPIVMADDDPTPSAFERLPDEIIQQILEATDPNGFASLILLNSKWRNASQQAYLYAHQLLNCPSYAASHKPFSAIVKQDSLPRLRRLFAQEVKRNLFEAYLRPKKTIIKVISNSISSSSCPGGEGIQFSSSPKGHHLLAYNSSRIYVVDVRGSKILVTRELKILRRPAATCVNDEGSLLAVLLTEMQVDIYNLGESPPKRTRSIILDHSPRAIALSPCGSILAAAYEGGIEVSSLTRTALATDRRAVKCDAVDALAFSFDGTQILGTTVHSSQPNTVILTAPYYDPGSHVAEDDISALWTTSILFPNTSRDCSHAVLIQDGRYEEAGWAFTYDRSFETFRAVRIGDLRNGTTYFTGPIPSPSSQGRLIPCTLPAASYRGELVSAGFQGKEIWLYGVPEDLDAVADHANGVADQPSSTGLNRRNSGPSVRPPSRVPENSTEPARVPQWQILCDKFRNTFVSGCKIAELDGVTTVKWVADFGGSSMKERLVVAARGVLPPKPITEEDGIDFVDGGRIILIDFDYSIRNGETIETEIEVGRREPEVLEEEHRDMDTEVAIVRRRTVAQKRGTHNMNRALTSAARPPPLPSPQPSTSRAAEAEDDDPLVPRRIRAHPLPLRAEQPAITEDTDTQSIIEEQEALDAPYSHASPRSGTTLRRAATAVAVNRRLHPPPPAAGGGPVQYRRADGRTEHPHESDADNWVPPPPPYQKEDPGDLPVFLRHAVPPVPVVSVTSGPNTPQGPSQATQPRVQPNQQHASWRAPVPQQPVRSQTVAPVQRDPPPPAQPRAPSHHRLASDPMTVPPRSGESREISRPTPSRSSRYFDGENIYDVSPAGSPPRTSHATPVQSSNFGTARTVSESAVRSRASEANPNATSPGLSPRLSQRPLPPVPRIQTTQPSPERTRAPALDLQIPSPSLGGIMSSWGGNSQAMSAPKPRPLSNAQTWPAKPLNPESSAALPAGYPHSAPPTGPNASGSLAHSFPPAPRPDQLASLNSRQDQAPRRLSGGFQLQRVPVGSRTSGEYARRSFQQPRPQPEQQRAQHPLSQPQQPHQNQHHSQPQQPHQNQHHSQPQIEPNYPRPPERLHQPQPRRAAQPPPVEDTPLIISTPKGVSGAFDPPDRRISGRRVETPILAPIPRHPRPNAQAAVLRPTAERLETIYSVASASSNNVPVTALGPSTYLSLPPQPASATARVPSLNRKQSRAERSAAKNIADAKKRGWSRRRSSKKRRKKDKQKNRDYDAASSAAWTDVTTASTRSGFFSTDNGSQGQTRDRGLKDKEKRCIVM